MSEQGHKLISLVVHTSSGPREFAVGVNDVRGISVEATPIGSKRVTILLGDGRYLGFYGFPVEVATEPQTILTPRSVELT